MQHSFSRDLLVCLSIWHLDANFPVALEFLCLGSVSTNSVGLCKQVNVNKLKYIALFNSNDVYLLAQVT